MRSILTVSVLIALSSASLAFAQLPIPTPTPLPTPSPLPDPIPVTLTISGNEVQGSFDFEGTGIGADLTIAFEKAVGLVPAALDVTVALVNPLDADLLGRLGPGLAIPGAFPVLIRIGPSSTSALSFSGPYTISFHTHNLTLDCNLPLSLFKASDGAAFKDITKWEGRGSYRDDGSGGDFSEFLIAVDLRQIDGVIVGKFDDLQATLTNNAGSMAPAAVTALQESLSQARALYNAGDTEKAIREMRDFSRYVKKHSGEEIPDVWRANCSPVVNVAGLLRSGADTLRFSLDRKLN